MSGGKIGDDTVASSGSKSIKDSIPGVKNLPAEVISHRERRRRLFATRWEKREATSPADSISHRMSMSDKEGRETGDGEDEQETLRKKADRVIQFTESAWITVSEFRRGWDELWSCYGSFEDTTRIPPMQFTDMPPSHGCAYPMDTLQLFSVKLAATRGRFQLPFDVFGMVSMRDAIDHNRNIIFQRARDDCQTLTIEDPYLVLTGPTRAVMMIGSGPVIIEADLKVKGPTESEDECLGPLAMPIVCFSSMYSDILKYAYTSKISTLEFTFGHIISSVEATIFVRVIHGSWPDGLRGVIAAFATGYYDGHRFLERRITGIGHERIVLLDSGGEKMPITDDGEIKLSRRVVSAETTGKMIIRVKALEGDKKVEEKESSFKPLEAGSSIGGLEFSFCKMEVTVFWSVISMFPPLSSYCV